MVAPSAANWSHIRSLFGPGELFSFRGWGQNGTWPRKPGGLSGGTATDHLPVEMTCHFWMVQGQPRSDSAQPQGTPSRPRLDRLVVPGPEPQNEQ